MKDWKSHFSFTKQERSGIFFLLALVVVLQLGYWWLANRPAATIPTIVVNEEGQRWVDSLKAAQQKDSARVFLVNPNYLSDYRAYVLGISAEALSRIQAYRNNGKYFNDAAGFQEVAQLPDSTWQQVKPLLKFPKIFKRGQKVKVASSDNGVRVKKDINTATEAELSKVRGIGEVLSKRIVKFRTSLGGFLDDAQVRETFGLEPEVADRLLQVFKVVDAPQIKKVLINQASAGQLAANPYIRYQDARKIVALRDSLGRISNWSEITAIPGFPKERIARIQLYLSLD
ncbi:ComEA family DNA-binding protein [Sediminicola luteus]|uniref:Competence protein ComEA n=1 Tax=Sediminicola luteus TaxID=319238 RepID=A0A2A4G3G4_9FLAO|nr:helix-hairpin-helix domain-containing protein [Sediminicola luteus]PCE63509.1 hypothetical protein B7P33_14980 [Sediminicola luteus]